MEAYLTAEVAGDYDTSFGLLAQADRDRIVTPQAWRATKSRTPRITGFTVDASAAAEGTVVTDVTLEPNVDPILGVVPGSARITWTPVAEAGGWRVPIEGSTFEARYPDDERRRPQRPGLVGRAAGVQPVGRPAGVRARAPAGPLRAERDLPGRADGPAHRADQPGSRAGELRT